KYNTSVNTFRNKYGQIPGDLQRGVASRLGFFTFATAGVGRGDGNILLEACGAGVDEAMCETLAFWRHLTDAQMIDGNFSTATAGNELQTTGLLNADVTAGTVRQVLPPAKLGRGNYIIVYGASGFNYFQITGVSTITAADGTYVLAGSMTPIEALNIDSKTDDGLPA